MNILGVTLRDDLKAADHIGTVLASCTRSLYALRLLRVQELASTFLHNVNYHGAYAVLCSRPGGNSPRLKTSQDSTGSKTKWRGWVTSKQMMHPLLALLLLLNSPCSSQLSEILSTTSEPSCHQKPALVTTCDHDLIVMSCLQSMTETLS